MSCDHCTKGSIIEGTPVGSILEDHEGAYFTPALHASGTDTTTPKRAVVLLTDAYGLAIPNPKIIADNLAKELNCDVWVPFIFMNGEPVFPVGNMKPLIPETASQPFSIMMKLNIALTMLPRIGTLWSNRASVIDPRAITFATKIRNENSYDKIGAIGYCWGGAMGVRLGSKGIFDSLVICHPAPITADEAKAITIPTSWVCAEQDFTFVPDLRKEVEAVFAAQDSDAPGFIPYEFKEYKGTAHGFACRPNPQYPEVVEGYEKAFIQTVEWFKKTLAR